MKKKLVLIFSVFFTISGVSQTIFGHWNSYDEETNKIESVIKVYEKDTKAYAKIISISDASML